MQVFFEPKDGVQPVGRDASVWALGAVDGTTGLEADVPFRARLRGVLPDFLLARHVCACRAQAAATLNYHFGHVFRDHVQDASVRPLHDGFETQVRSSARSGGQRQRTPVALQPLPQWSFFSCRGLGFRGLGFRANKAPQK